MVSQSIKPWQHVKSKPFPEHSRTAILANVMPMEMEMLERILIKDITGSKSGDTQNSIPC